MIIPIVNEYLTVELSFSLSICGDHFLLEHHSKDITLLNPELWLCCEMKVCQFWHVAQKHLAQIA